MEPEIARASLICAGRCVLQTSRRNEPPPATRPIEPDQVGTGPPAVRVCSRWQRRAVRSSASRVLSGPRRKWRCGQFLLLRAAVEPKRQPRDLFSRGGAGPFSFSSGGVFLFTKVLDRISPFVYKSLVSKFEMRFCQKSARTSLVRLANQGHPAVTGAGRERLAVKVESLQAANPARRVRSLKIEAIGDFARGQEIPRIRIAGQWLEQAGFKPGNRVQVLIEQPGSISLRFVEEAGEAAL